MKKILLVTGNKHKEIELRNILSKFKIDLEAIDLDINEIQAESIEEIAIDYAKKSFEILRVPLIVEDSGLFIDSLKGFPGPYSSFVFKTIGCEGILKLMENVEDRKARFVSVIAYADEKRSLIFKGEVKGEIAKEKRGIGWGFDPIFIPKGSSITFGEMDVEEKNNHSHRGKSAIKFAEWFSKSP